MNTSQFHPQNGNLNHRKFNFRKFKYFFLSIFILRGIAIQCIYPPMEGPDEYQHIAYFEYLNETHKMPIFGTSFVPESFFPDLISVPHSEFDLKQTGPIGCLGYDEFYSSHPPALTNPHYKLILYQAQHPPLYYLIFSPIYIVLHRFTGLLPAIFWLRILNTVIAALAAWMLLKPIRILFDSTSAKWFMLVFISLPMYMIYSSRIANDALALFFCGAAVTSVLSIEKSSNKWIPAGLTGLFLGAGLITKLIAIAFVPAIYIYLFILLFRTENKKTLLGCIFWMTVFYCLAAIPFHYQSFQNYGTLFPSQLTIKIQATGVPSFDVLHSARWQHLLDFFLGILIRDNLWLSGWTFLKPSRIFTDIYFSTLLVCALGFIPASVKIILSYRKRQALFQKLPVVILCLSVVIFSFTAAYIHALHKLKVVGFLATPPYYSMAAFPSLLAGLFLAAQGYGKRFPRFMALLLVINFTATEIHSFLNIGLPVWTATENFKQMFQRLLLIHPAFPSPYYALVFYFSALMILFSVILRLLSNKKEC